METVDKLLPSISGMFEYLPIKEQAKQDPDLELDLELNLVQVIEQMRKTGPVPPDLRVDDRDIKEHPNFYSWCFGSEGVGVSPFSRQMAIASTLLAEVCPNRRCTKRQFWNLENIPVDYNARDFPDKITFLEYGRCPKCGARKSELYRDKRLNIYQELCGIAGQRSGKSALVALLIPYLLHKWLKLQKPTEALGLMPNSILTGTLVALTFNKAISLLWSPMINSLLNAPFFQQYHECLDYYGEKHGIELYRVKDTFLNYNYKNIFVSPSGPNKRTLRGESRLFHCVDEHSLVTLIDGNYEEIKNIKPGDEVKTHGGQHKVNKVFDNGIRDCYDLTLETRELTATGDHKIRCLGEDGRSLVWKKVDEITEHDFVLVED